MTQDQKTESSENSDVFQSRGFQKIDKAVNQSIAIVKQAKLGQRDVLPTSWKRLNKNLLGGLQKGKMYVIAGRPGVGKSAFSNQLIFDVLDTNAGKKLIVLYWTFEMPGYQQVMRSASKDVKKQMGDLLSIETPLSDIDFKTYASKVQKYGKYPIYFNNIPRTMEYIMNTNEELALQHPSHTVINLFDHSRLIRGNEDTELRRLNTISKGCMWMQSKLGAVNILLSQLNRNIEQEHRAKNQYQPLLTDLFGGDSIGQDAHVVMILNRPNDLYGITAEYCGEDPKGLLACHVEKNRDGLLGMIGYEADMSTFNIKERK
jgi:replicative DNA helicase|tara:strand:+ start:564 stop:1514 length:951 start_codon:yes stop_codon:yes gene_type:complete